MKKAYCFGLYILVSVSVLVAGTGVSHAADESGQPTAKTTVAEDADLSLEKTLEIEQENFLQLKEQLTALLRLKETMDREVDAYKLQMTIYGNLLMFPTTEVTNLEKARENHQVTLGAISDQLRALQERKSGVDRLQQQVSEKYTINEKQLSEIKAERSKDSIAKNRVTRFEALVKVLAGQNKTISEMQDIFTKMISRLEQSRQSLAALTGRFDQEIPARKKQDLFQRKSTPFASIGWGVIKTELSQLPLQILQLVTLGFWTKEIQAVWVPGSISFFTFFLLLFLVYLLFVRIRHYCVIFKDLPHMSNRPWGRYTIDFIQRSLPLLGITVFLYIYARVRLVYSSVPFVQFVVYGFAVFLFCRWASDALRAWGKANPDSVFRSLKLRLHVLVVGVRGFAIAYIFILWIVGDGGLLFLLRLVSEAVFFYWCVSFLKDFRKKITTTDAEKSKWHRFMVLIVVVSGYTIAGGGLLLELVGYGKLALFWYTSWGRSLVVLMWAGLLLFSFREWNAAFIQSFPENKTDVIAKGRPLNWLILRLSWLAWAAAVFLSLLLAWGGTQTVFVGLVDIVTYPIQIGSMNLRLIGFVYATVILLCTHAATRLWGDFLKYRFLSDSGIELGLQQSITTVTIYLLWGLGILLSLNVMGLSTTSIAVVFGALSIGLGFGLQNIFNNFISGIILLFERPVQVGDVIQINDIWGAVTKINVRSTVVQTFDNASLIIPNSDLISNQVTNWSFKDPRLRRNIVVGVAYGSDIALVRDTLMEIAEKNGRALKRPKPDVLFEDFADSTLIFKLRVWSTVDDFVRMETEIRFEIDRLFKERNIEIAFPQLDVHVRSMAAKKDPAEIVPHEKAKPATVNGAL